jgi:hypothetical protein
MLTESSCPGLDLDILHGLFGAVNLSCDILWT